MITFPLNWREVGQRVSGHDIDEALREVVAGIDCANLSYSGGMDSSLLLDYLLEAKGEVSLYTAVNNKKHPDLIYADLGREYFEDKYGITLKHVKYILPGCDGDELVRRYYSKLAMTCKGIITGDGIDELACGYYAHQSSPDEETYLTLLSKLQVDQLQPLNINSGDVRVFIPYLDIRIVGLLHRIPISAKVSHLDRKIIMKDIARERIPEDIIERKKYGLGTSI